LKVIHAVLRRGWILITAASVLIAVAAIAEAAIPDSNGVIHACYQDNNGNLRVIDTGQTCKNNESPLNWSQTGPQGPQGPVGPVGPQGPQGQPGSTVPDLYASYNSHDIEGGDPHQHDIEIVGLSNLPAGTYLINATVTIYEGADVAQCYFDDFNNYTTVSNVFPGDHAYSIPLTAVRTFPSSSNHVSVICGSYDDDSHAVASITALRVNPAGVKP
jgi:hypothetical protein